jgi:hypothetical protein
MLPLLKKVIHLDNSGSKSVGSGVEEVIQWDKKLCQTKMFTKAVTIPAGRRVESPNLESQLKILLNFIGQLSCNYFRSTSPQAKAFDEVKVACKQEVGAPEGAKEESA